MTEYRDTIDTEEAGQLPAEDPNVAATAEEEDPLEHIGQEVPDLLGVQDLLDEDQDEEAGA